MAGSEIKIVGVVGNIYSTTGQTGEISGITIKIIRLFKPITHYASTGR